MQYGCECGLREVVQLLVDGGANIHHTSVDGSNSLHLAAMRTDDDDFFVNILLNHGININAVDMNGNTALHKAVRLGRLNIVKSLLNHGADINIENKIELTAFSSIAMNKGKMEIAKVLLMHIARVKASNATVSEKNLQAIKENVSLNTFFNECVDEIESMKNEKFDDSVLTVYHLLRTSSVLQYMGFARNENIVRVITAENFKSKFRIYGDKIVKLFEIAKLRNRALRSVVSFFKLLSITSENKLPKLPFSYCAYGVFLYLCDEAATMNLANVFFMKL